MVSTPEKKTLQLKGFETANTYQGYIWPLYPHSTNQTFLRTKVKPHRVGYACH